jgi:hypothetical protein
MARSDAVIIARPKGNAMVEVVQTYEVVRTRTREREVGPDGHGEVNSRPQAVPTRVGIRQHTKVVP